MKIFKIKIWKFQELLHCGNYQFNTVEEANNYALGLFAGMNLFGAEATGIRISPVKKATYISPVVKEEQEDKKWQLKAVNQVIDNPANRLTETSLSLLETLKVSIEADIEE